MINKSRIPIIHMLLLGFLPNFLKRIIYYFKCDTFGKNIKIGFGSLIIGDYVSIGNNVKIGFFTIIRGNQIKLADNVFIGSMTFLDCPHITVEQGARITEQVVIGGPETLESKFVLGKNAIVMQGSYINPVCPVTIGNDSCIGGNSLIFSHSSWLNIFEGYPQKYEPITIGNGVWVAWRVFVLPGTVIGDGSVIGANSLVRGHIPSNVLAAGSPAKVISQPSEFPKKLTKEDKLDIFQKIIREMTAHFQFYNVQTTTSDQEIHFTYLKNRWFKTKKKLVMRFEENEISPDYFERTRNSFHMFLSLERIPDLVRQALDEHNISWIDIHSKERSEDLNDLGREVALYLRHYGIRLLPS